LWLSARHTLGDESVRDSFDAGGFLNLSGFQTDELSGSHLGLARGIYYHRIRGGPLANLINVPLYLGGSLELGNVWNNSDDIALSNALLAGSALFAADTFIGPVFLAAGYAEGGNTALYLSVGKTFP
jgi:NTE family protein